MENLATQKTVHELCKSLDGLVGFLAVHHADPTPLLDAGARMRAQEAEITRLRAEFAQARNAALEEAADTAEAVEYPGTGRGDFPILWETACEHAAAAILTLKTENTK
jgi:hypothetical protein